MNAQENIDNLPVVVNVPITLSDRKTTKKLTKAKQKAILQEYQKHGNLSKACLLNGIDRRSFYYELQKNQQLSEAMRQIDDFFLDAIEETSITVASQPSREGFNDRKLLLQAKRPEIYGNKLQVDQTTRLEAVVVHADLRNILTSNKLAIE